MLSISTHAVQSIEKGRGLSIRHIRMDNGLNKLSKDFTLALARALQDADKDRHIGAIVLSGGEKAFSVGADIHELVRLDPRSSDVDEWIAPWRTASDIKKPLIMALEGYVLGGGLELAMMGDIILATPSTTLGQPEIKLALIPGCGGTVRLIELIGYHRTFDMCARGIMIDAKQAYAWGLVNSIVSANALITTAFSYAETLCLHDAFSLHQLKEQLKDGYDKSSLSFGRLQHEIRAFKECLDGPAARQALGDFVHKKDV